METPNGNGAFLRTLVRLPVVVHIIAVFFSKKSFGVVPHSMTPGGWMPSFLFRSTQNCSAPVTPVLSNAVCVPAAFISWTSFAVVRPWNSQYGKPDDGISIAHWLTLPEPSRCTSFLPLATSSSQVSGALSGSRPAALNASLFQNITMVERWNGMPQVWPPVWLLAMNAG